MHHIKTGVADPDPLIFLGSWIRIHISEKLDMDPDPQVKIQKLQRFKLEPWRAVDAHTGGLEA
jgi:hypothetical protein